MLTFIELARVALNVEKTPIERSIALGALVGETKEFVATHGMWLDEFDEWCLEATAEDVVWECLEITNGAS